MQFMHCTTCHHLVQVNATGICMGCQMGFAGPQEDSWEFHREKIKKQEFKGVLDDALEKADTDIPNQPVKKIGKRIKKT